MKLKKHMKREQQVNIETNSNSEETEEPRVKQKKSFISKKNIKYILVFALILIVLIVIYTIWDKSFSNNYREEQTIVTSSQLEKVVQISELSTYKVTFNGVAEVKDPKKEDKVLYYVAYEAQISVGLDMKKIKVEIEDTEEENRKTVVIVLPEIEITNVNVDPGSFDYIFESSSANTSDVSITAQKVCKTDAEKECKSNIALFNLARENAAHTVEALMKPLLEQRDEYKYELKIIDEGGYSYE